MLSKRSLMPETLAAHKFHLPFFFLRQSHWLIGIFVLDTENCLFPKNTEEWGKKQIKEA
jgi:hypothetical protein